MYFNLADKVISGSWKMNRPPHRLFRIFKVYIEASIRFSHTHSPGWSQPHITFKVVSWKRLLEWEQGQNVHSQDRGGGKKPLIVQVQLVGQVGVTSPQGAPPTLHHRSCTRVHSVCVQLVGRMEAERTKIPSFS